MSKFCRALSDPSWTRRFAAAVAASVALTTAGVMPAHAADEEPPVILNASVSHKVIDVIDGPAKVTVRLEVKDASGVATGYPQLDPTMGAQWDALPSQTLALVSGDHFQGIYETTFTFPEGIRNGEWTFLPTIIDRAGNHGSSATYNDGIGTYPTVLSTVDVSEPRVTTSISQTVLDITDGPAKVVFTANAYDDGVGILANMTARINSHRGSWSVENSSTDLHKATFRTTFEYAKYNAAADIRGRHAYSYDYIMDANGNIYTGLSSSSVIVATRPLRAKRPDLRTNEGSVIASWTAHDDLLGVLEYETELTGPNYLKTVKTSSTQASLNDMPAGTYTARVRARNQLGWGEWTTPSVPVEYIPAPMVSGTPTVSGTAKVGQTLTANPGTWTPGATLAYRWFAGGVAVSGATGSTLVLGPSHAGKAITVRATGSKPGHVTVSKTSAATAPVAKGALAGITPTVTGTARVGSTLTANPGTWSPASVALAYQWYRSGVAVTGAAAPTYSLTAADLGKTMTVTTTARKSGYNVASRTSRATAPVAANVLTAPRPVIPRTAAIGQTLTAKTGTWSPAGVKFTYQWHRNGSPIPGATAASYKPVSADRGSALSIRVTGRKSGYPAKVATSNPTSPVTR